MGLLLALRSALLGPCLAESTRGMVSGPSLACAFTQHDAIRPEEQGPPAGRRRAAGPRQMVCILQRQGRAWNRRCELAPPAPSGTPPPENDTLSRRGSRTIDGDDRRGRSSAKIVGGVVEETVWKVFGNVSSFDLVFYCVHQEALLSVARSDLIKRAELRALGLGMLCFFGLGGLLACDSLVRSRAVGVVLIECVSDFIEPIDCPLDDNDSSGGGGGSAGSSYEEALWVLQSDSNPWPGANTSRGVVFDNRVWWIGSGANEGSDTLWSSLDLENWSPRGSLTEPQLEGFQVLAWRDQLWVLGTLSGEATGSVLRSDGGVFQAAAEAVAWPSRQGHTALVFDERLWVIGGRGDDEDLSDVWVSSDGLNWEETPSSADWRGRSGHTSLVFGGRMWILGGVSEDEEGSTYHNDVWHSSDGETWRRSTSGAPWSGRSGHSSVVFDGRMWVLGGFDGSDFRNDVWSSADGSAWSRQTEAAMWSQRRGHSSVEFRGQLWLLGGNDDRGAFTDVWTLDTSIP